LNAMSALWKQCPQSSSTISLRQTSACMARGSEKRSAQTAVVRLFVTKYKPKLTEVFERNGGDDETE
jgi:hypothetical protein